MTSTVLPAKRETPKMEEADMLEMRAERESTRAMLRQTGGEC